MSIAKLKKIGNSFGFRVSKNDLETAGFDEISDYEVVADKGVIFLFKRSPHVSKWIFKDTCLSKEDKEWLEAKLESTDQ